MASFTNLKMWIEECNGHAVPPLVPRVLVGNKCDLKDLIQVPSSMALKFADAHNMLLFETSAKDPQQSQNVDAIFMCLACRLKAQRSLSSFTCGLAGAVASNPVDVVRTRMMNQRAIVGSTELYKGTLDGLVKTWKSEGFFALYKGFWPNWLRLGPWNIIVSFSELRGGRGYGQAGEE
nr:PREDICTED: GTP-binding protein YPTM1-like [Opisthocomus hoazin]